MELDGLYLVRTSVGETLKIPYESRDALMIDLRSGDTVYDYRPEYVREAESKAMVRRIQRMIGIDPDAS